jgi:hypothetical protein
MVPWKQPRLLKVAGVTPASGGWQVMVVPTALGELSGHRVRPDPVVLTWGPGSKAWGLWPFASAGASSLEAVGSEQALVQPQSPEVPPYYSRSAVPCSMTKMGIWLTNL